MVIKKCISINTLRRASKQAEAYEKPDDILYSLRRVPETYGVNKVKHLYTNSRQDHFSSWRILCLLSMGIITLAWGIASLIFTPLEMLLNIRIEMTPGLPPYEWWLNTPDEVLLKAYIFNITNSERFLNGTDERMMLKEIGPIIYREKFIHSNATHNDNGTLSYTSTKKPIFLPEMNTINLNDTVYVPNLAVLLIPGYFQDSSMILRLGANILLRSYNAQPIVKTTIQNYLWNITDPILEPASKVAPGLVPTKNLGILNVIYSNFKNNVSVFIGKKHGNSKFFTINTFDGSEYLPHFSNPKKCQQRFRNASEGVGYPQMITKDTNLTYWRKILCKQADIRYARDDRKYGIDAYRFELVPWAFDRIEWEGNKDCYVGSPALPSGLIDISPCYWGFPIIASFPHFLYGDDVIRTYVDGLTPNKEDHGSYVMIEPITGIPLEGKARSQINLVLNNLVGFPKNIQRFSNTVIPLAWLEYYQVGIPWYIQWMVYFTAVIVPTSQLPLSILSSTIGLACAYFTLRKLTRKKEHSAENLINNKILSYESQTFLKGDC